jgi:hypothetical protein
MERVRKLRTHHLVDDLGLEEVVGVFEEHQKVEMGQ